MFLSTSTRKRSALYAFWMLLALCLTSVSAIADKDKNNGPLVFLGRKYQELSGNGKLATGACIGFVGSRLVVKSATTAVKVAGLAFIT